MKKKNVEGKKWSKASVEAEIEELKNIDSSQVTLKGVREPKSGKQDIKRTHLDLTPYLLEQLDDEARKVGMNRQSLIKHYILNGLKDRQTSAMEK